MLRKSLALLLGSALFATMAAGQTAGELIAKNNQAQGGSKLRSVKTVRMSGTLTFPERKGESLLLELVPASHKVRREITDEDGVETKVYDGAVGWEVSRSEGKTELARLTGDALNSLKDLADFQGALFDYQAKGNEIEYLGKDEIDGKPVYKLWLTRRDGVGSTIYLDAKSHLEVREKTVQVSHTYGREFGPFGIRQFVNDQRELVTTYSDFKTIDGVTLPCTIETKLKRVEGGGTIQMDGSMRIDIDKVELNVDIPASRFTKPKTEER
jgi:outer membrane lipoprotein-sorting protein